MDPVFKTHLAKCGYLYPNKAALPKNSKHTHTCMDGGLLLVPITRQEEFNDDYIHAILSNKKCFLCELPTSVCRMYVDFDMKYTPNNPCPKNIIKILQDVVYRFYNKKHKIIMCETDSNPLSDQEKTGVHYIWPDLFVTSDIARDLAAQFVLSLEATYPDRPSADPWKKVVDPMVYKGSLRMVGSSKTQNGKEQVGRVYYPTYILDDFGTLLETTNTPDIIKSTFLRVTESVTLQTASLPEYVADTRNCNSSHKYDTVNMDEDVAFSIVSFIASMQSMWHDITSQRVTFSSKDAKKSFTVKTSLRFCTNKNGDHNGHSIYFVISDKCGHGDIVQKCWCKCDTVEGRIDGKCSDYTSAPTRLPDALYELLYPESRDLSMIHFSRDVLFPNPSIIRKSPTKYATMIANTIQFYKKTIETEEPDGIRSIITLPKKHKLTPTPRR